MSDYRNIAAENIRLCLERGVDHLNLAGLGLDDVDLESIPEFSRLSGLRYLDLTGNRLTHLPTYLVTFRRLIWLGLNFNRLESVAGVQRLVNLKRLYLRGNRLEELPENIGQMEALLELDLTDNPVKSLPIGMGRLEKLEHIGLEERFLVSDQLSAYKEKGWLGLRSHLALWWLIAERLDEEPILRAAKVILIGERENGKTWLQQALRGEQPQERNPSTEGMNREILRLNKKGGVVSGKGTANVEMQLWDMGGQHDYRHMHQLLFSPHAIYLAVVKPRSGGSVDKLESWLDLVHRRTAARATVIVVFTFGEADESLNIEELSRKFPGEHFRFKPVHVVDSGAGTGIVELRKRLVAMVNEEGSPFIHRWLPGWRAVFKQLTQSSKPYITWDEVERICGKKVADAGERNILIRTGHLIGAWLWREDTPDGRNVVVLQPQWLNRAVARLLEDETTRKSGGLIQLPDLARLWMRQARDGEEGFPEETHPMLIQLLEINELAYRPHKPGCPHGEGDLLLVTQMVKNTIDGEIEEKWEKIRPVDFLEAKQVIGFAHRIPSLSLGSVPELMYLLIFRLRRFSLGREDYTKAVHWQDGMLVRDDFGSVGRIELMGSELHVTVRYVRSDSLFYVISNQIGETDADEWNGLIKKEFVFCGIACSRHDEYRGLGLVSLSMCHRNMEAGMPKVNCGWQGCEALLSIEKLLPKARAVAPSQTATDAKLDELLQLIQTMAAEQQMMKDLLDRVGMAVDEVILQGRMQAAEIIEAFGREEKAKPSLFSVLPVNADWWKTNLTEIEVEIFLWCEWSLVPVFFHGETYGDGLRGIVRTKMPRAWVVGAKRWINYTVWALMGLKTFGFATAYGAATGAFDRNDPLDESQRLWMEDAFKIAGQLRTCAKDIGDEVSVSGDPKDIESLNPHPLRIYGAPTGDEAVVNQIRKIYEAADAGWGGLERVWEEGKWSSRHPKWQRFGKRSDAGQGTNAC